MPISLGSSEVVTDPDAVGKKACVGFWADPMRWILLSGGVVALLFAFVVLKIPLVNRVELDDSAAFAQYIIYDDDSRSRRLHEQAKLFDSAPLFLPTKWNYGSALQDNLLMRKGDVLFKPYPPSLLLEGEELADLPIFEQSKVNRPRELLANRYWSLFGSFGEAEEKLEKQPAGGSFLIVQEFGAEVPVRRQRLPDRIAEQLEALFWAPTRFSVTVDAIGMVGAPKLTESSGFEMVDSVLREYLLEPFFSAGLSPGYYRVEIWP